MKFLASVLFFIVQSQTFAQSAIVNVKLSPMGSFKAESSDVKGFAEVNGGKVSAKNIVVGLKKIKTGIGVRDDHTRKHLDVEKFPEAVLVSAEGENGKGKGILRIRGVEKAVTGTYKIVNKKLEAVFPIKLSDYGITGIKYMGAGVNDTINISVVVPTQSGRAAASAPARGK